MKIYLIRHGEPDYGQVTEAKYKGFGRDLSRLTSDGIQQAQAIANHAIFDESELLLVSPYTRTMQTALEITRFKEIPVCVELLLHEWLPDKTGYKFENPEQMKVAYHDYLKGTKTSDLEFETKEEVYQRVASVFQHYKNAGYTCIACVTHAEVIRVFTKVERVKYCGIYEMAY
ncbi:hypothetical protein DOK78_000653 [Enterococcus sp. DIV2402]|uniref:Histidine phosphatase family protein n=1 Tax=Candidatus Enterococcus lowellii TaxID=2230877 RepID=A0ABZ2SJL0_9ENTE|nr:histidine phosphatase family protein [Enterococcus sp. DIV2402]MBO0465551.1 histidine phosphatase family protein [Enterococcus sp. DIV2402]